MSRQMGSASGMGAATRGTSSMAFALLLAVCVWVGLLSLSATPAEAAARQKILNPITRSIEYRYFDTIEDVAAAARASNMSVQAFIEGNDLEMTFIRFDCPDGSSVVEPCLQKLEGGQGGLCVGPNWEIYNDDGTTTIVDGATGKDVCRYSTCTGMRCEDPTRPLVYEELGQMYCSCMASEDVGSYSVTTPLDSSQLFIEPDSRNYPTNNDYVCGTFICESSTVTEPAVVTYDHKVSQCVCYYPANQYDCAYASQNTQTSNWPNTFPATETETQRPTTTRDPNEDTPDPIATDSPLPTVTQTNDPNATIPPGHEDISASRAVAYLCPLYPRGLTQSVWNSNEENFCCTVFRPNNTWTGCGSGSFFNMPVGWGFCESTIPSYGFCCEVERMHSDIFVFRGVTCKAEVPPYTIYDAAVAPAVAARAALVTLAALVAAAVLL